MGAKDIHDDAGPLLRRLRVETRAAHGALETALALVQPPLSLARFRRALRAFHGFHLAWEPRVTALVDDETFLAPRRRFHLVERDLAMLGEPPDAGARLDLEFLEDRSAAWGSLYVMEGSTLGGQLITRALRELDGVAPEGLAYFNPYGRRTAAMWRAFCDRLELEASGLDAERVIAGATGCFEALQHGLGPPLQAAA